MEAENKPEFVAELTPHRSLGRNGFLLLIGFIAVTCFTSGIMFWVMGAWPVFIAMALDVLIIWFAFHLNYRSARAREVISVARDELKIQQYDPRGRLTEHNFNPFWTRFEVERHDEIGITSMRLTSKDFTLPIGAFLNPDDKESFADAFKGALGRVKA
jgi:uncharacterized membrane protein